MGEVLFQLKTWMGNQYITDNVLDVLVSVHAVNQPINPNKLGRRTDAHTSPDARSHLSFMFWYSLPMCFYQDGHFENTYYSDFISNLARIKYAGELLPSMDGTQCNRRSRQLYYGLCCWSLEFFYALPHCSVLAAGNNIIICDNGMRQTSPDPTLH